MAKSQTRQNNQPKQFILVLVTFHNTKASCLFQTKHLGGCYVDETDHSTLNLRHQHLFDELTEDSGFIKSSQPN